MLRRRARDLLLHFVLACFKKFTEPIHCARGVCPTSTIHVSFQTSQRENPRAERQSITISRVTCNTTACCSAASNAAAQEQDSGIIWQDNQTTKLTQDNLVLQRTVESAISRITPRFSTSTSPRSTYYRWPAYQCFHNYFPQPQPSEVLGNSLKLQYLLIKGCCHPSGST